MERVFGDFQGVIRTAIHMQSASSTLPDHTVLRSICGVRLGQRSSGGLIEFLVRPIA